MTPIFGTLEEPRFRCAAGTFVGRRDGNVLRATGIRYARAGRFEPPTAEPPADRPVAATTWAPESPQRRDPFIEAMLASDRRKPPVDEHCQRLSVTVPGDLREGERLPVMVWIHGGSYVFGGGDDPLYDPTALVTEQRVVVVTVTYRLGIFGYLGGRPGRPGNLGLLDQLEALRWVRDNIAGFGGDADMITVFGESAGADAIAHLMIAEDARGLFRRAIMQSPPLGISRSRGPMAEAMLAETAALDASTSIDEMLAAQDRAAAVGARFGLKGAMPFGTQYGLGPLPAECDTDVAWGRIAPEIDVLIGSNAREAALFAPAFPDMLPIMRKTAGIPVISTAMNRAAISGLTRAVYARPVAGFVRRHRRSGGRAWRYSLSWGAPRNPLAAAHGIDIPLLFENQPLWAGSPFLAGYSWPAIQESGSRLRAIWAGFARTGYAVAQNIPGLIRVDAPAGAGDGR